MATEKNKDGIGNPKAIKVSKNAPTSRAGYFTFLGAVMMAVVVFFLRHRSFFPSVMDSSLSPYAACSRSGQDIYTVDPEAPQVQCIVVNNTRITGRGSLAFVRSTYGKLPVHFIPKGSIIVPGLTDSHVHLLHYGWGRNLNLDGCSSVAEVVSRIRDHILSREELVTDKDFWIEGFGWDQSLWEGGEFPHADDLEQDPVIAGRLIVLHRKDVHAAWVSKRALELTMPKIPRNKKVDGGSVILDAKQNPTGVFLDNAIQLIPVPPWDEAKMRTYFEIAIKDALSYGLTSVHDAFTLKPYLNTFLKLADEGAVPLRLYLMVSGDDGPYWGRDFEKLHNYADGRINVRGVKIIVDGAIGSWGALMYKPYDDNPSTSGFFRFPIKRLKSEIPRYLADGWQVNIHCIGDRANGEVLDILEKALRGKDTNVLRPRIEHAQIIRPSDIPRFAKLGIIASVQPTHATSDMLYADTRLGERVKGAYAYQSLLRSGARITLGSDFPVESANPLVTFYAAITRLDMNGTSPHGPDGWYPEQKLSRAEALKGLTLDGAYASFAETELGSLEVGKRADFVVLDKDIMTVAPNEILKTRVLHTVVDGRVAYTSR